LKGVQGLKDLNHWHLQSAMHAAQVVLLATGDSPHSHCLVQRGLQTEEYGYMQSSHSQQVHSSAADHIQAQQADPEHGMVVAIPLSLSCSHLLEYHTYEVLQDLPVADVPALVVVVAVGVVVGKAGYQMVCTVVGDLHNL
jgi:hypothetical protein